MDNNQRGEHLKLIEGGAEQLPTGKLAPNYSPMSIIIKTATVLMVEMMMVAVMTMMTAMTMMVAVMMIMTVMMMMVAVMMMVAKSCRRNFSLCRRAEVRRSKSRRRLSRRGFKGARL